MIDRIVLDMDGVLVRCAEAVHEFHGKVPPYKKGESSSYDLAALIGISATKLWAPLGREFWANLEPLPDMSQFLHLLEKRFGSERICLLTSPIRTDGCIDGKMDWIRKWLPDYSRRFLVGPAKQFCAAPNAALVDDYGPNVDAFRKDGGHALLVPAPWNSRYAENRLDALQDWLDEIDRPIFED